MSPCQSPLKAFLTYKHEIVNELANRQVYIVILLAYKSSDKRPINEWNGKTVKGIVMLCEAITIKIFFSLFQSSRLNGIFWVSLHNQYIHDGGVNLTTIQYGGQIILFPE